PQWTAIAASGLRPPARTGFFARLDGHRRRILVFGGAQNVGGGVTTYLSDLWSLSLANPAWTALAPAGVALARAGAGGAYDEARDRIVLCGGNTAQRGTGDVSALDLENPLGAVLQWEQLVPSSVSPPNSPTVLDPVRNRMLAFGTLQSVWSLPLAGAEEWSL